MSEASFCLPGVGIVRVDVGRHVDAVLRRKPELGMLDVEKRVAAALVGLVGASVARIIARRLADLGLLARDD